MSKWSVVYKKAISEDGELFFPQRLTHEFLETQKRVQGSYIFANQYQNEIIPEGDQVFKKEWKRYYKQLPDIKHTFAFIDPAISQSENSDYTGLTVIDVDVNQTWYLRTAQRFRINPTQVVALVFKVHQQFKTRVIGIEEVAYQKALLYMLDEEMRRRQVILPVTGVNPGTDKTKEMRILGLVPRFEWGRILLAQGLTDLEMELDQFPRGSHDDLIDSLSQLEQIVYYPQAKKETTNEAPPANHPGYEKWYIQNIHRRREQDNYEGDGSGGDD